MPRTANTTDALLADLNTRLAKLVATAKAEGREDALADLHGVLGGSMGSGGKKPSSRKTAAKPAARKATKKKRKNPWAGLTPAQKLKRVNAIRKGRGLPVKKAL